MLDIRDMELLVALAQHGHFARAAESCGISQPAFSTRIRNLEQRLGAPIVKRGNRFMGLTAEGEIALKWARRLLGDADGLRQEIEEARAALSGRITIGAVPTALAFVARVPVRLRSAHPGLTIHLFSLTTAQIHQGLDDFSLDAGITYVESDVFRPAGIEVEPLYDERYVVLAPASLAPRSEGSITWREAAALPLCLLTRNMRNRRFLDGVFERVVGEAPRPVMETDGFTAVLAQVATGAAATVAPQVLADTLLPAGGPVRLALVEPEVTTPIGLLVNDRDPAPPALLAFVAALRATIAGG